MNPISYYYISGAELNDVIKIKYIDTYYNYNNTTIKLDNIIQVNEPLEFTITGKNYVEWSYIPHYIVKHYPFFFI